MTNKKRFLIFIFCLFVIFHVSAEKLGERIFYKEKNVSPSLAPNSEITAEVINFWNKTYKKTPVFFAESLHKIPANGNSIQDVSEILRSFSTMEGIEFYSNRRGKWTTLYDYSKTVSDLKKKTPILDDTSGNADGKTLYMVQNDISFGSTPYEVKYWQKDDVVAFNAVNKGPLYAGIVKAVKNDCVCLTIFVKEDGDNLLVYILAQADFVALPIIEKSITNSFSARIDALNNWFIGKCNEKN